MNHIESINRECLLVGPTGFVFVHKNKINKKKNKQPNLYNKKKYQPQSKEKER